MRDQFYASVTGALNPPEGTRAALIAEEEVARQVFDDAQRRLDELTEQRNAVAEAQRQADITLATLRERVSSINTMGRLQEVLAEVLTTTRTSKAEPTIALDALVELDGPHAPHFSAVSLGRTTSFEVRFTTKPIGPSCDIWGGMFIPEGKTGARITASAHITINTLSKSTQITQVRLFDVQGVSDASSFTGGRSTGLHTNQQGRGTQVCLGSFASAITNALASNDLLVVVEEVARYLISPNLFEAYTSLTSYLGTLRNPWLLPAHPSGVPHLYMVDDSGYVSREREEAACACCGAVKQRLLIRGCRFCMTCCTSQHTQTATRGLGILGTKCLPKQ